MAKIPTVMVVDGNNFKIINQSDFDPDKHQLYTQPKKTKKQAATVEDESA